MPTAPKKAGPQATQQAAPQRLLWSRTEQAGRKWYASRVWQTLRQRHLRENPACVECIKEGKPMAQAMPQHPHVDHINPHRGQWSQFINPSNLQTLCHQHHSKKTRQEQRSQDATNGPQRMHQLERPASHEESQESYTGEVGTRHGCQVRRRDSDRGVVQSLGRTGS